MPKKDEQYWQYDPFTYLVSQLPSEEIAIFRAEASDELIVFVASLHEVVDYPYTENNKVVLGPGVVQEGHSVNVNGQIFGTYPRKEGSKYILGPDVSLKDNELILGPSVRLESEHIVVNGMSYGNYPKVEGKKVVLGPNTVLDGYIVTVNREKFYKTCDQLVTSNGSKCIMPRMHRSNQHEDIDGNVRYG